MSLSAQGSERMFQVGVGIADIQPGDSTQSTIARNGEIISFKVLFQPLSSCQRYPMMDMPTRCTLGASGDQCDSQPVPFHLTCLIIGLTMKTFAIALLMRCNMDDRRNHKLWVGLFLLSLVIYLLTTFVL